MLDNARALVAAGYSVIPVSADGTKAPADRWKPYQTNPASDPQLVRWFESGDLGLGVVCGTVSGNLEMLEFEGRAVAENVDEDFCSAMIAAGHVDLLSRIMTGHSEQSPSGGCHLFYRVDGPVSGNLKLASRDATDDELTDDERIRLDTTGRRAPRVLIETRGEGGYVVVAPTNGRTHPSGRPWTTLAGGPSTVPVISAADRVEILRVARSFNRTVEFIAPDEHIRDPHMLPGDLTPGEDFCARADWRDILEPAGWVAVSTQGSRILWRRPGKRIGVSAATGGPGGDYLFVWSTSTELPSDVGISKWRTFAMINYAGNWAAAARALRSKGYGSPPREPTRPAESLAELAALLPATGYPGTVVQPVSEATSGTFLRSDDGNGLALVDMYGSVIRYNPERGQWLDWTGHGWEWCGADGGHVREYGKVIARELADGDAKAVNHKRHSLSDKGVSSMVRMAKTDPRVVVKINDLDARPYELATPNGIVDLFTGHLLGHDPTKLHTRIALSSPDYHADQTAWLSFLADTFAGHPELPGYMQRLIGYSAVGRVREHILPFCFGAGGNGKSVLLETILAMLGNYGTSASNSIMMAQTYSQHPTEIARLSGSRMVVCSEVNITDKFDEAKVKELTGGDQLTARFMRQDGFTFAPTHTLWLMGNHQPTVEAGGPGFWRRLRLIPFLNTVTRDREIPDLQGRLVEQHGPAIMAWIVVGAVSYLRNGLQEPDSVTAATDEYAHDQDSLGRFIEDNCHITSNTDIRTNTKNIRSAYVAYCQDQDLVALNGTSFGRQIRTRFGVQSARSNGERFYVGIAVTQY